MKRIIVALDVESDTLEQAYDTVCKLLGEAESKTGGDTQWEWYDDDGNPIDPETIQQCVMAVLDKEAI